MRSAVPLPCIFDVVKSQLEGPEGHPAGSKGQPGGDRWKTEFLPILQDFVLSQGRCLATLWDFTTSKMQGKGTADLMMSFGNWLDLIFKPAQSTQISLNQS